MRKESNFVIETALDRIDATKETEQSHGYSKAHSYSLDSPPPPRTNNYKISNLNPAEIVSNAY